MDRLLAWRDKPDRLPLVLCGVRQCGKTWLLKEFGAKHYPDVAYFDFERDPAISRCFDQDLNPERILTELGVLAGRRIEPGVTLVIFDEIQACPRALTALKYFADEMPLQHIACGGSLLGVALAKPSSFPVGKVEFQTLHPLTFYEFAAANGKDALLDELAKLEQPGCVPAAFSPVLESLLRDYQVIGGMPRAVAKWLESRDIGQVEAVQDDILAAYELDMAKHAPATDFPKLVAIWRSTPGQLAKENTKFIFSQVRKGWRARDLEDAVEWLISAGMVYKVRRVELPSVPLAAYADDTYFKLYACDVGLVRRLADVPASVVYQANETYKHFKGALTENLALTELVAALGPEIYFWRSGNQAEVDFIVRLEADIVPVEVKSERNTVAKSLSVYRAKYSPERALTLSMKPDFGANIPLYLIWRLTG
jgi:predicted AAA+ superfamily ATPase